MKALLALLLVLTAAGARAAEPKPKRLSVAPNSDPVKETVEAELERLCGKAQCYWTPNADPLKPNVCVKKCREGTRAEPLEPPLPKEWGAPGTKGHRACACVPVPKAP